MGMTIEEYESSDLMAENEFLRKQLAEALKHRRMFEADYENRLKSDLEAILVELQSEIEESENCGKAFHLGLKMASNIIQQKINKLKEDEG